MAAYGDMDSDLPELISEDEECSEKETDDAWDDLDEDDNEEQVNVLVGSVQCLFCQCVESSVDNLLTHCINGHQFNLLGHCKKYNLDCISFIKMINFIRRQHPNPRDVAKNMSLLTPVWSSDEYMVPVDPDDLMLQLDLEWAYGHSPLVSLEAAEVVCADVNTGDAINQSEAIQALIERVQKAERDRDLLKEELDRALEDIEKLRLSGQNFFSGVGEITVNNKREDTDEDDDGYFASYGHHDIHMTMLKDKVRTVSYRDFMLKNPHLFEGKTVLDVGCGTGILSMFAVKAGASNVVAVDQSDIIYQAMDIARENNVHEKITFVKGCLEDVKLPVEKFDVIISEWMGYFLLFEAMLDSVLWARDRYLKVDGCVYPDQFSMLVAGLSDPDLRRSKLDFWDNVYGYKMSCMKPLVIDEVHVLLVKQDKIITEPAVIKTIDVMKCQVSDLEFSCQFSLICTADAEMTALVGYFITAFDTGCHNKIKFSTGPEASPTHWEQSVMLFPKPISVQKNSKLSCDISYTKHPQDLRGISIHLTVQGQKMKFTLS